MEKFSKKRLEKAEPEKNESKYKNDNFSVITFNDKDVILSKDKMIILPYLRDDGFILMKYKKFPAFSYRYKDNATYQNEQFYVSCISGDIIEKDNEVQNLRRIVHDETGLVLSTNVNIEVDKIVFKSEDSAGQYHFCLLNLSYNDYKQVSLKMNDDNKTIKVSLGDIDDIKCYDMATEYMILKFKYEINI